MLTETHNYACKSLQHWQRGVPEAQRGSPESQSCNRNKVLPGIHNVQVYTAPKSVLYDRTGQPVSPAQLSSAVNGCQPYYQASNTHQLSTVWPYISRRLDCIAFPRHTGRCNNMQYNKSHLSLVYVYIYMMQTSVPGEYAAGDACSITWTDKAPQWFQMGLWMQAYCLSLAICPLVCSAMSCASSTAHV